MLDDRASVKRSVVGSGCSLGTGTKVGGCRWLGQGFVRQVCVTACLDESGQRTIASTCKLLSCHPSCIPNVWNRLLCHACAPSLLQQPLRPGSEQCCAPGTSPQVVNSVVGDDVRTGANCAIHNCVIASGCTLGEGARLRDCQLGPGYSVPAGADLTDEVLPPPPYRE